MSLNIQYLNHIEHESWCVKFLASQILSALVALFVGSVLTLYVQIIPGAEQTHHCGEEGKLRLLYRPIRYS